MYTRLKSIVSGDSETSLRTVPKLLFFVVDSQTYGSPERREREKISVEAFCESDLKLFSLLCL